MIDAALALAFTVPLATGVPSVPAQVLLTIVIGLTTVALVVGAPVIALEYCRRTDRDLSLRSPLAVEDRRERL